MAAARGAALDAVYQHYVGRGDLVFDIGGHGDDRVASTSTDNPIEAH